MQTNIQLLNEFYFIVRVFSSGSWGIAIVVPLEVSRDHFCTRGLLLLLLVLVLLCCKYCLQIYTYQYNNWVLQHVLQNSLDVRSRFLRDNYGPCQNQNTGCEDCGRSKKLDVRSRVLRGAYRTCQNQ